MKRHVPYILDPATKLEIHPLPYILDPATKLEIHPLPYILDPASKLEICTVSLSFILVSLIFISHLHFTPGYYNLLWYMSCHSVLKLLFILFYIYHCIFNITPYKKMDGRIFLNLLFLNRHFFNLHFLN